MKDMIFRLQEADTNNTADGTFYVIETFPSAQFVLDEEGEPKAFDKYEDALSEAAGCQEAYVISL